MCEYDVHTIEPGNKSIICDYTALYNAVDSLDNPTHIKLTDEYFQSVFSTSNVNFERDTILVRNDNGDLIASGLIIGQNALTSTLRLIIQVHPEYRRQGIGSRVLHHLTEIGLAQGTSSFVCSFPSFRPYVSHFARNNGFNYEYSWTKMGLEHKTPVSTPSLPWGLTIRGLNIKKELSVWAIIQNSIFKDNPRFEMVDTETLRARTEQRSFDRNLLVLGMVSMKPVGLGYAFSIPSEPGERTLMIDAIGVLPEYRRNRYGQALLFELLNRAYIKRYTSSEVVVLSSNRPAIRLLEKCGFRERCKYFWFKRIIEQ